MHSINRASLIGHDNVDMRCNFACTLGARPRSKEAMLEMLRCVFETVSDAVLVYVESDPGFELMRDDPRYTATVATPEAITAAAKVPCDKVSRDG